MGLDNPDDVSNVHKCEAPGLTGPPCRPLLMGDVRASVSMTEIRVRSTNESEGDNLVPPGRERTRAK